MNPNELHELISHYRELVAPEEQQILIMLLKEVQQLFGGVLPSFALHEVAEAYHLKSSLLQALTRRIPSLRTENAPHRLEICKTCRQSASLAEEIEHEYEVRSGGISKSGGFSYHVTGCMKNCKNGPSIRWDGTLVSHADMERIRGLVNTGHV